MRAFFYGVPIGILGGLIGLGGAEFRLPVLVNAFGCNAKRAVPINLAISLLTVLAAFVTRASMMSLEGLRPLFPIVIVLAAASMAGAYVGTGYLSRVHDAGLGKVITGLLLAVGGLLIVESFFVFTARRLFEGDAINVLLGFGLGLGIGVVSSLLGVAGGELIIPTLVLVFGVDVKDAGTASLLISMATITIGLARYSRQGRYHDRRDLNQIIIPMGMGSLIGTVIGGALVGMVSSSQLKLFLGLLLITSAVKLLRATGAVLFH
jgi:uncharacterized membrane protein YfcA